MLCKSFDDIINSDVSLKDKYWFFCKKVFTKEQNRLSSLNCSEIVFHIFNKYYNENKSLDPLKKRSIINSRAGDAYSSIYAFASCFASDDCNDISDYSYVAASSAISASDENCKDLLLKNLKDICYAM